MHTIFIHTESSCFILPHIYPFSVSFILTLSAQWEAKATSLSGLIYSWPHWFISTMSRVVSEVFTHAQWDRLANTVQSVYSQQSGFTVDSQGLGLAWLYSSGPSFPSLSCGYGVVSLHSVLSPPQLLFDWFHLYVIHLPLCSTMNCSKLYMCHMPSSITCRSCRPLQRTHCNYSPSFLFRMSWGK